MQFTQHKNIKQKLFETIYVDLLWNYIIYNKSTHTVTNELKNKFTL